MGGRLDADPDEFGLANDDAAVSERLDGVGLLAICTLAGVFIGDLLGAALHVKSNVGGVGIAMGLLIAGRVWLMKTDRLSHGARLGIEFWGSIYIPIVVAMAATQDVVSALAGGPVVLIAGAGTVLLCFGAVALVGRFARPPGEVPAPIAQHAETVLSGDPQ